MVLVMGTIAIVIYEKVGLAILRSAWINLDLIWAVALIAAGLLSLSRLRYPQDWRFTP